MNKIKMKKLLVSLLLSFFFLVSTTPSFAQALGGGECSLVQNGTTCKRYYVNICCHQYIPDGWCYQSWGYALCTDCWAYSSTTAVVNSASVTFGDSLPDDMSGLVLYKYPEIKTALLSPNPVVDKVQINLEFAKCTRIESITIVDQNGRMVKNAQDKAYPVNAKESYNFEVELQSIPSGIYQVVIKTTEDVQSLKLIKS